MIQNKRALWLTAAVLAAVALGIGAYVGLVPGMGGAPDDANRMHMASTGPVPAPDTILIPEPDHSEEPPKAFSSETDLWSVAPDTGGESTLESMTHEDVQASLSDGQTAIAQQLQSIEQTPAGVAAVVPETMSVNPNPLALAEDGFVGPTIAFDPFAGIRTPGLVQRVERVKLRSNQTPAAALAAMGTSGDDISGALASMADYIDFRRMRPGDDMKARFDAHGKLVSLDVMRGMLDQARTKRGEQGWAGEKVEVAVDTVVAAVSGAVTTSLWDALITQAGEDPRLVAALVDIFAYDIDFYTEVRPNDAFSLLVEKRYANGQFVEYGEVAAAEFVTGTLPHRAFMHHSADGTYGYYDEHGQSMRKQLLKAPLKYAPVTSTFGVRKHPILGYTRNHNGTDYGVPIGTPVWSVGDGRVITAGVHSGFGKLVEVSHPNGWISQYAHLSKINVRPGQHVRQKDIVGLVGMTGLATGPHLHYGLKKNGHYVNSLLQKFERAKSLDGAELAAFGTQVAKLIEDLSKLRVAQQSNASAHKG